MPLRNRTRPVHICVEVTDVSEDPVRRALVDMPGVVVRIGVRARVAACKGVYPGRDPRLGPELRPAP